MSKYQKGFTLIELLVVVGIIAILAIAALIAINPLEAQRRTRDSARLQDMARLQAMVEVYVNDQGFADIPVSDDSGPAKNRSDDCANSWFGTAPIDLCSYIKSVPKDPLNGREINAITYTGTRSSKTARYGFAYAESTGNFAFCTYLEAENSEEILKSDPFPTNGIFETGNTTCTP